MLIADKQQKIPISLFVAFEILFPDFYRKTYKSILKIIIKPLSSFG
jgi:hypothetical protein